MIDPFEIPCRVLVEMLTDYLEDALPEDDRARFEAHLEVCPPCVYVLDQFRAVMALSGELREADVDALEPEVRSSLVEAFVSSRLH